MRFNNIIRIFPALAAALLILAACSHEEAEYQLPKFAKTEKAKVQFLGDELMIRPYDLAVAGDYILASTHHLRDGNTLFVFDKNGTPVKAGIKKGRAKGETMFGYLYMTSVGENIIYHDITTKEFMAFNFEEFMTQDHVDVDIRPFDSDLAIDYAGETCDGKRFYLRNKGYLSNVDIPTRSVLLYDQDGVCHSINDAPIEDPIVSFYLHIQPRMAASNDGKHLALSTTDGAILEIFDITDGIERTFTGKFIEPVYDKIGRDYLPSESILLGFGDMFATDEGIYIVYDGTHKYSELVADKSLAAFSNIAFFDWNGKPQKLIKTDYRIESICGDGEKIYAFMETPEGNRLAVIE